MLLALEFTRQYGVNGGDLRKIDTRSILIDFDILEQMTDPEFITNLKAKSEQFVKELKAHKASGKTFLSTQPYLSFDDPIV